MMFISSLLPCLSLLDKRSLEKSVEMQLQYNDTIGAYRFPNDMKRLTQFEAVCIQMVNMNPNGMFEAK